MTDSNCGVPLFVADLHLVAVTVFFFLVIQIYKLYFSVAMAPKNVLKKPSAVPDAVLKRPATAATIPVPKAKPKTQAKAVSPVVMKAAEPVKVVAQPKSILKKNVVAPAKPVSTGET